MNDDGHNTPRLAALIDAKRQVLEIVTRLAQRQLTLIDSGEMTGLFKLLAAKQTVMSQLQALEQQLVPFRDGDPELRVWPSAADRAACQRRAEECNTLLAEALALEQDAEQAMLRRREAAAVALGASHAASEVRSAYAAPLLAAGALQGEG